MLKFLNLMKLHLIYFIHAIKEDSEYYKKHSNKTKFNKPTSQQLMSIINNTLQYIDSKIMNKNLQTKTKAHLPLSPDYYYMQTLYLFLDNSSDKTGINFSERLQKKYDLAIKEQNIRSQSNNQPIYKRNQSFRDEMYNPWMYVLNTILYENFFTFHYNTQSKYSLFVTYSLYGKELNNIQTKESNILQYFNYYLEQQQSKLRCFDVLIENQELRILLGELERFELINESIETELDMNDEDFNEPDEECEL